MTNISMLPQNLQTIMSERNATMGPPDGFGVIKGAIPRIVGTKAREILGQINGTSGLYYGYQEEFQDDDGNVYLAKIEPHYDNHPKGGGPSFWHIGVSVYKKKDEVLVEESVEECEVATEESTTTVLEN